MKIELEGVTFGYSGEAVLRDLSMSLDAGEVLAVLGPSGSGKTTLLHLIAGFLRPSAGRVRLGGGVASAPDRRIPSHRRGIGMVFQDLALWPHLTVAEHLDFALAGRGRTRSDRDARKSEVLELVELAGRAGRRPAELSGGEEQRLAFARALVGRPRILLLDEPLGALDPRLRHRLLESLAAARERYAPTTIHVTHDFAEACLLADRLTVLERGRFAQTGAPEELWRHPATPGVAAITGPVRLVEGRFVESGRLETSFGRFAAERPGAAGASAVAVLRPPRIRVVPDPEGPATVEGCRYAAGCWEAEVRSGGQAAAGRSRERIAPGARARLELDDPVWTLGA